MAALVVILNEVITSPEGKDLVLGLSESSWANPKQPRDPSAM